MVQVSTQQKNPDGSYSVAEALTFIPHVMITDDVNNGKKLISSSTMGVIASSIGKFSYCSEPATEEAKEEKVNLWGIKDSLDDFLKTYHELQGLHTELAKDDPDPDATVQDIMKLVVANRENKLDVDEALSLFNKLLSGVNKLEKATTFQERVIQEKEVTA